MKDQLTALMLILTLIISLPSCTSQENDVENDNQYLELYQNTYDALHNILSSTRAEQSYSGPVTSEEIASLNSLEKLTSYDQVRLREIEVSETYEIMKTDGIQHLEQTKNIFTHNFSLPAYGKLVTFTKRYIAAGTHNKSQLQQSLINTREESIKKYMALSAAVVDAYGEEHIWKNTFEIASLTPCDEAAIKAISLVLVGVAIDLGIDSAIPWATFITMANTINSICTLVTIHNEWVDCTKNLKK